MFTVLILVCSIRLAPADCGIDNALDVISGPAVADQATCEFYGQTLVRERALAGRRDDAYLKVRCQRTTIGNTVG
jgi:hypothetical protein